LHGPHAGLHRTTTGGGEADTGHRGGRETLEPANRQTEHDPHPPDRRYPMGKRGRKKRDRKHSKANHGKRPNA